MDQTKPTYPRRIQAVTHKLSPEGFVLVNVPARHIRGYVNIDAFEVLSMCSGQTPIPDMAGRISKEWGVSPDRALAGVKSALSYLELIQVVELTDRPGRSAPMYDRNRAHTYFNHLYLQVPGPCRHECPGCLLAPPGTLAVNVQDLAAQAIEAGVMGMTVYGPGSSAMITTSLVRTLTDNGVTLSVYEPHPIGQESLDILAGSPGSTLILPLSASSPEHPMTAAAAQTAARALRLGVRLSVRVVIDRIDPEQVLDLVGCCAGFGASEVRLRPSWDLHPLSESRPLSGLGRAIEYAQNELLARESSVPDIVVGDICHIEPDYFACGAGVASLWVSFSGTAAPCHYLDIGLGAVTGSLEEFWAGLPANPEFERLARTPAECADCEHRERCYGGCAAARLALGGLDRPDPGRCEVFGRNSEVI